MNVIIRNFGIDDAETLFEIESKCFTMCWGLEQFTAISELDYSHFFVAECDGKIVGFAGFNSLDVAEILNIAVISEYRNNGIGRMLLERCEKCASECGNDKLYLEVRISNESAVSLYKSFGFHEIGVRKKYYTSPVEDAIIMLKEI